MVHECLRLSVLGSSRNSDSWVRTFQVTVNVDAASTTTPTTTVVSVFGTNKGERNDCVSSRVPFYFFAIQVYSVALEDDILQVMDASCLRSHISIHSFQCQITNDSAGTPEDNARVSQSAAARKSVQGLARSSSPVKCRDRPPSGQTTHRCDPWRWCRDADRRGKNLWSDGR